MMSALSKSLAHLPSKEMSSAIYLSSRLHRCRSSQNWVIKHTHNVLMHPMHHVSPLCTIPLPIVNDFSCAHYTKTLANKYKKKLMTTTKKVCEVFFREFRDFFWHSNIHTYARRITLHWGSVGTRRSNWLRESFISIRFLLRSARTLSNNQLTSSSPPIQPHPEQSSHRSTHRSCLCIFFLIFFFACLRNSKNNHFISTFFPSRL